MFISAARIPVWLVGLLLLITLSAACSRAPHLTEYDEQSNSQARSAPLVVVGVADADVPIGRTVPSRHDPVYPMQLHRVRVRIENVLKGSVGERTISVYYFAFAGGLMVRGRWGLGASRRGGFSGFAGTVDRFGWLVMGGIIAQCS